MLDRAAVKLDVSSAGVFAENGSSTSALRIMEAS